MINVAEASTFPEFELKKKKSSSNFSKSAATFEWNLRPENTENGSEKQMFSGGSGSGSRSEAA